MILLPSFLLLGLCVVSSALKVPFNTRQLLHSPLSRRGGDFANKPVVNAVVNNGLDLTTVRDLIYMSNMSAGGQGRLNHDIYQFAVQMDTGSSDLWLKADNPPLVNSQQTVPYSKNDIQFGIGWVYGTVSYISNVEFAGITVAKQAYLDVTSANNPALSYNADGLIGLGFTSLSTVDSQLNKTGASDGRSLLYNLFQDNPATKNFMAFSFQRSTDSTDDVQGGFSIGEYEENYTSIANTPTIPTWPVATPKRWNVLVEAFIIGNNTVLPSTEVSDAPGNKGVALLDTGTSYSYTTKAICDAIYGSIEGAFYDATTGYYNVPCNAEIDMAIQIGGRVFPLHPLDMNPSAYTGDNTCLGSFVPGSIATSEGQFDYIFGVNVLRSMYSLYDFGDFGSDGKMGTPYVQLLSLIDPDKASKTFCDARGCTARTGITYQKSDNTYDGPASSVSVSGATAEVLDKFNTWFPAMLGIMALNAVVLLGVLILGIVLLCRKCRKRSASRVPVSRRNPTPLDFSVSSAATGAQPHTYAPVSMAITEDTMVPPSPAFHKFEGSTLKPGDRPKSLATLPSNSKYEDDAEEALLSPASPGFRQFDMRPHSVGMLPSHNNAYQKMGEDEPFIPPGKLDYVPESPPSPSPSAKFNTGVPRSPSTTSFHQSPSDETLSPPSPTPSARHQQQQQQLLEALTPPPPSHGMYGNAETTPLPPSPSIRSFRDSSRPPSHYVDANSRPSSHYLDNPARPTSRYVDHSQQRPAIQLSQPPAAAGRPSPLTNHLLVQRFNRGLIARGV
ncbi:acid protease [Hymenopellis radicata]|nr:acid protease [Hymenopellis radicata]